MLRKFVSIAFSSYRGFLLSRVSMSSACKTIDYNQLKNYIEEKTIYLIDVREKKELEESGVLPNSINIPIGEVETALQLSEDQFKAKYCSEKPDKNAKIVFSCKAGGRSAKALDVALKLGYENALNYGGGWNDWEHQTKC